VRLQLFKADELKHVGARCFQIHSPRSADLQWYPPNDSLGQRPRETATASSER
jgi:hypothetical protein